jgi:ABC-2 type transport system permease protein
LAVYKHEYRKYAGELTARWQRILVLPRYTYREVFQSRFFTIFFVICFLVPLGSALLIYLHHNLSALNILQIPANALLSIDASFFIRILFIQSMFAFFLTVWVGPRLVSPDLSNNALALYLSRPFSKFDYVFGKMLVLLILQSFVTWVPLLFLFLLQGNLAEGNWMGENVRILLASIIGSVIWMVVLSLLALAVSAWVRWRAIAGAMIFGVFFVSLGFGNAIKAIFITRWGDLFNLSNLFEVIWEWLFYGTDGGTYTIRGVTVEMIPVWSAWAAILALCGACIWLLYRKIRAYEVVR